MQKMQKVAVCLDFFRFAPLAAGKNFCDFRDFCVKLKKAAGRNNLCNL